MESKKIELEELKRFWKGKRVFITGHTGFKGSWLSIILDLLGAQITGYALRPEKKSLFNEAKINQIIYKNFYNNILDSKNLSKAIKQSNADILIHMAAQPLVKYSYNHPEETFKTNAIGTLNILCNLKNNKSIKSTIIVTTDKVYKIKNKREYKENDELGGHDPYSSSKVCAEIITQSFISSFKDNHQNLNKISTARSGNVIGGGDYSKDRLIPDILKNIKYKNKLIIRNPNAIRPWQHVIEPVIGYLLLAQKQYESKLIKLSKTWNFGPSNKNFKSVIHIVKKIDKSKKLKLMIEKKKKFHETKILLLDSSKAHKYLGWSAKWDLDKSLDKIIEWEQESKKTRNVRKVCENQILTYFN
jgi:CDP-glucose 4,6-dehydratase